MSDFNTFLEKVGEIGFVEEAIQSLVYVSGLPKAAPSELVIFESGEIGQVRGLSEKYVEVLVFSKKGVKTGTKVARTNSPLEIPVGTELLGMTIDPFCMPVDDSRILKAPKNRRHIDIIPSGIKARAKVKKVFDTGVSAVDLVVPIGSGQRELVMGDRKTGKTNFLYQAVLAQAEKGTVCIYAMVGKKKQEIKKAEEFFAAHGKSKNIIIIASSVEDSPGVIYLTPYSAMTIAEYFRDEGRDSFVVLDDLTTHAKFYREISLLGGRFPGRNSYPGDIFYTHSKLLERAGNFICGDNEVSITCIPVAETIQGDLTGYIQTNLMSMTDGHLFFDNELFAKGIRPSINPFLSVTRVGHQTQNRVGRELSRELLSFLTLFEKMQGFVHFGAELNTATQQIFYMGENIFSFLDQPINSIIPRKLQTFIFTSIWSDIWKGKNLVEKKNSIEKMKILYSSNEEFRTWVDSIIDNAASFNELIRKVRSESANILSK